MKLKDPTEIAYAGDVKVGIGQLAFADDTGGDHTPPFIVLKIESQPWEYFIAPEEQAQQMTPRLNEFAVHADVARDLYDQLGAHLARLGHGEVLA